MNSYDAIIIVSFGGPEGPDDVMPFLANVTRGRDVPPQRLAQVARQYDRFGGVSPLNAQNRALIAALRTELERTGRDLPIYWGNRNWQPYLADTVRDMHHHGVRRALAFVTSAYSSYSSCRQYLEDIAAAQASVGPDAPVIDKVRQFYDHPGFIEPMADNLRAAMARAARVAEPARTAVIFTAHSIPLAQASGCDYEAQLHAVAALVAERSGAPSYRLAFQSRSGPPSVPWLLPDVGDCIDALADDGALGVVVSPIGFVSDHLEVVFDLDQLAAERAARRNVHFERAATPGTDARFVAMIRELIEERLDPVGPRRSVSALEPRPDVCPRNCCPSGRPSP